MKPDRDQEALARAMDWTIDEAGRRADDFDARAEVLEKRSTAYAEHDIQSINDRRSAGVCVRVWIAGAVGFASSHDLERGAVRAMVDQAARIAETNDRQGNDAFPFVSQGGGSFEHHAQVDGDPFEAEIPRILEILGRTYDGAQERDPEVKTSASFSARRRRILYADSSGRRGETSSILTTLAAMSVRKAEGRTGSWVASLGGQRGLDDLERGSAPEELGVESAEGAQEALEAKPVPSGRQRVLFDNHLAGVLAHESFGHLIEADVVEMNWSLLAGRMGERFADEIVNVVDTPEPPEGAEGGVHLPYDQEGVRGREVRILDEGVLEELLHVRGSAFEAGIEATGNGRAIDAGSPVIVRMRNTFFEPGEMSREEALEELGDGVYLVGNRGGAPASDGTFMFTAKKGYVVEDGEIQHPIRSTSVSGHILDFLENVEGLTDDFNMKTTTFGGCGKWGQSFIPVGIGGPHILADDVLLGGDDR